MHDAAHALGLRSNDTIMFGHVDGAPQLGAPPDRACASCSAETGGFTEFVPLPFVHMEAPIYLKGRARTGPTLREVLLMHAVGTAGAAPADHRTSRSRGSKAGAARRSLEALRAGVNDLGGTLMNESISRAAGAGYGQELPPEQMEAAIRQLGRTSRQRTTLYGTPPAERTSASYNAPALIDPVNPPVSTANLKKPARLIRPGVAARS